MARDPVEVNFNASTREYCHVLRFPLGWPMPIFYVDKNGRRENSLSPFRLNHDYEFRVPGLLETKFLVRGVEEIVLKYYTSNVYEADFSDPKGVAQPASEEEWNSATPIPLVQAKSSDGVKRPSRLSRYVEFKGRQFTASGDKLDGAMVSPDRSVLVNLSWSGKLGSGGQDYDFRIYFGTNHGKLFFEFYNADTGKKLVAVTANFTTILPEEAWAKTGWVTGRYFLIPLDERRERCLVCEFGHARE